MTVSEAIAEIAEKETPTGYTAVVALATGKNIEFCKMILKQYNDGLDRQLVKEYGIEVVVTLLEFAERDSICKIVIEPTGLN